MPSSAPVANAPHRLCMHARVGLHDGTQIGLTTSPPVPTVAKTHFRRSSLAAAVHTVCRDQRCNTPHPPVGTPPIRPATFEIQIFERANRRPPLPRGRPPCSRPSRRPAHTCRLRHSAAHILSARARPPAPPTPPAKPSFVPTVDPPPTRTAERHTSAPLTPPSSQFRHPRLATPPTPHRPLPFPPPTPSSVPGSCGRGCREATPLYLSHPSRSVPRHRLAPLPHGPTLGSRR